jgi:hypothetical protein
MSVKDRWVDLHEQVLNVLITCFIGCYGREAGYEPVDWSAGVLWIGMGAFLLVGSGSVQIC